MEALEKIDFEVYRGEREKVTKTNIAEIRLFKNAVEVLMSYDYTYEIPRIEGLDMEFSGEPLVITDICRLRVIMPREGLGICESVHFHPSDRDQEYPISMIILERAGVKNDVLIRCRNDEAKRLYKILRNWILVDKP